MRRSAPELSVLRKRRPRLAWALSTATIGVLLAAQPAGAHVGQDGGGAVDGLTHPLFGPDHLVAMLAVGALAAIATDRRIAWLTPIGFVTGMLVGALLGFASVGLPAVELVIGTSVVVLGGLLIVLTNRNPGLWLPALAVAFGVAHGHAHGSELPSATTPLVFVAGFVATTLVLHLAGTAVGLGLRRTPSIRVTAGATASALGVALLLVA